MILIIVSERKWRSRSHRHKMSKRRRTESKSSRSSRRERDTDRDRYQRDRKEHKRRKRMVTRVSKGPMIEMINMNLTIVMIIHMELDNYAALFYESLLLKEFAFIFLSQ